MPLYVGASGMCRQADKTDAVEIPPRFANTGHRGHGRAAKPLDCSSPCENAPFRRSFNSAALLVSGPLTQENAQCSFESIDFKSSSRCPPSQHSMPPRCCRNWRRQVWRDVHASKLSVPELQFPQQIEAQAVLQSGGEHNLLTTDLALPTTSTRTSATRPSPT